MRARKNHIRRAALWLAAISYVGAGVTHFTHEAFFLRIIPPALPSPRLLVHVSGVAEMLGGLGLLIPSTRRWASYGLVALLIAVYPANVSMALNPERFSDLGPPIALYLRLPVQFLFIAWVIWVGRYAPSSDAASNE